jgi:hypothetical protein
LMKTKIPVMPNTEFDNPTLADFLRYRIRQQVAR